MNLLKIENGWNIAGEDIAEKERTEGKDSATNKIWMAKRWEYIHREYEYLNSGFFFYYYSRDKGVHFPLEFFIWKIHVSKCKLKFQILKYSSTHNLNEDFIIPTDKTLPFPNMI